MNGSVSVLAMMTDSLRRGSYELARREREGEVLVAIYDWVRGNALSRWHGEMLAQAGCKNCGPVPHRTAPRVVLWLRVYERASLCSLYKEREDSERWITPRYSCEVFSAMPLTG